MKHATSTPKIYLLSLLALTVQITPVSGCPFQLVNAATNSLIKSIDAGKTINLARLGLGESRDISVVLQLDDPGTQSVKFSVNGAVVRCENGRPYSLMGDIDGGFLPWNFELGPVTLEAVRYEVDGCPQTDIPIAIESIHFTLVDLDVTTGPTTVPSLQPSVSPSREPTASPTASQAPSHAPSSQPSVSQLPSANQPDIDLLDFTNFHITSTTGILPFPSFPQDPTTGISFLRLSIDQDYDHQQPVTTGGIYAVGFDFDDETNPNMHFSTTFGYRMHHARPTDARPVADGMTFFIHQDPRGGDVVGGTGGFLGIYENDGIAPAIVVELDSCKYRVGPPTAIPKCCRRTAR